MPISSEFCRSKVRYRGSRRDEVLQPKDATAYAALTIPWDLRPIREPTDNNSVFRTLSSKYLWWKLLYALRMTAVAMLPIAALIAAPATSKGFVSKGFATSGALITALDTLGGSLNATWAWLKAIPLTVPLLTLFVYVDLYDSPYAWGAVYCAMMMLTAFMCEGLTKRLAILVSSIAMVGQLHARYDGKGLGTDLQFPARLAAEYTMGCVTGVLCTLIPWPRLASRRVDRKLTEASSNIALCYSGLCDTFWTSSNMQRRVNMVRIQLAKKNSLSNLQDARACLDVCRFEPQRAERYYLRLAKNDLLGSFLPLIESTLRLLEAIADDPSAFNNDPSAEAFGSYLSGPLAELASSVDSALFLIARASTIAELTREAHQGASGEDVGVMAKVKLSLLMLEAAYARSRRDLYYRRQEVSLVCADAGASQAPLSSKTAPKVERRRKKEGNAQRVSDFRALNEDPHRVFASPTTPAHFLLGGGGGDQGLVEASFKCPVRTPVAQADFNRFDYPPKPVGRQSGSGGAKTNQPSDLAHVRPTNNNNTSTNYRSRGSTAREGMNEARGGGSRARDEELHHNQHVHPSASDFEMSATAQDFAALMSYYMFTLALFAKRTIRFSEMAQKKVDNSQHWFLSFLRYDVWDTFTTSMLYLRDVAAFFIPCETLTNTAKSPIAVNYARRVYAAVKLREAVKVSVAMGLCVLFYYYTDRKYAFTGGPSIIAFVVANTSSEALNGSLIRMFGTLFGGVVGFFCARLTDTPTDKVGALMALMFICGFFRTGKQYGTAAVYGCFVIVPMLQPNVGSEEAISRIIQITFAAIIYSFISALVFPARPQYELQSARSTCVVTLSNTLRYVMQGVIAPFPPPLVVTEEVYLAALAERDAAHPHTSNSNSIKTNRDKPAGVVGGVLGGAKAPERPQPNNAGGGRPTVIGNMSFRRVVVNGEAVLLADDAIEMQDLNSGGGGKALQRKGVHTHESRSDHRTHDVGMRRGAFNISAVMALPQRHHHQQTAVGKSKGNSSTSSRSSSSSSPSDSSVTGLRSQIKRNARSQEEEDDDLWEAEEEDWDSMGWEAGSLTPPSSNAASPESKDDGSQHHGHPHHHHRHHHNKLGVRGASSLEVQSPTDPNKRSSAPIATPHAVPDATFQPPAVATVLSVSRAEVRDAKTKAGMRSDPIIARAESAASALDAAIHKAAEWMPFAETEPMLTRVPYPTTLSKELHTSLLKLRSLADLMLEALKTFRLRRSSPSPMFLAVLDDLKPAADECIDLFFAVADMIVVSLTRRHAGLANAMVGVSLRFEEKCVELHKLKAIGFQQVVKLGRMVTAVVANAGEQVERDRRNKRWRRRCRCDKDQPLSLPLPTKDNSAPHSLLCTVGVGEVNTTPTPTGMYSNSAPFGDDGGHDGTNNDNNKGTTPQILALPGTGKAERQSLGKEITRRQKTDANDGAVLSVRSVFGSVSSSSSSASQTDAREHTCLSCGGLLGLNDVSKDSANGEGFPLDEDEDDSCEEKCCDVEEIMLEFIDGRFPGPVWSWSDCQLRALASAMVKAVGDLRMMSSCAYEDLDKDRPVFAQNTMDDEELYGQTETLPSPPHAPITMAELSPSRGYSGLRTDGGAVASGGTNKGGTAVGSSIDAPAAGRSVFGTTPPTPPAPTAAAGAAGIAQFASRSSVATKPPPQGSSSQNQQQQQIYPHTMFSSTSAAVASFCTGGDQLLAAITKRLEQQQQQATIANTPNNNSSKLMGTITNMDDSSFDNAAGANHVAEDNINTNTNTNRGAPLSNTSWLFGRSPPPPLFPPSAQQTLAPPTTGVTPLGGNSDKGGPVGNAAQGGNGSPPHISPQSPHRKLKLLMSNADAQGMHTLTLSLVIFAKELKRLVMSVEGLQQHMLTGS